MFNIAGKNKYAYILSLNIKSLHNYPTSIGNLLNAISALDGNRSSIIIPSSRSLPKIIRNPRPSSPHTLSPAYGSTSAKAIILNIFTPTVNLTPQ